MGDGGRLLVVLALLAQYFNREALKVLIIGWHDDVFNATGNF